MKHIKSVVCTVAIGLILVAQLMRPVMAYADGDITSTPTDTVVVTSTPVPTDTPTEVVPSETPTPLASASSTVVPVETNTLTPEATTTPELIETTVVPVDTDTATPEPPTEIVETVTPTLDPTETTPAPTDVPAVEQPTLLETVQTIPGDSSVVVLDKNGQPLPLASQAAADVIENSDPMWCPAGQAPTPGANGCTDSYTTMNALLTNVGAYIDSQNTNGTIWITSGLVADDSPVVIDGSTYTNWANNSITLQGGWSGTSGNMAIGSNSVFFVPISITNWNNSVTVNNVSINNSSYGGLYVNTNNPSANVTINTVTVDHASGFGLGITTNGGSVLVKKSTFSNTVADYNNPYFPFGDGADIMTNGGNVDIIESKFIINEPSGGYGAWISAGSTGNITLKSSELSDNYWGMVPFSSNNISIYNTNTFQNNYIGIGYSDCKGNLALEQGINFSGNTYDVYNLGGCADPINLVPTTLTPGPPVDVPNDKVFTLDCDVSDKTYSKNLPNGDLVEIHCPAVGDASIVRLDSTTLPADLPDGYTYASAFEVNIKLGEKPIPVIEQGGYIRASFIASYLQPGSAYDILYWDAWEVKDGKLVPLETGKWVPLKDYILQAKGPRSFDLDPETANLVVRKIISGVRLLSKNTDKRVEVTINFPGIFVLVQQ